MTIKKNSGRITPIPGNGNYTWLSSCFTRKFHTRLERLTRDNRSSSIGHFISDEEKSFVTLTPGRLRTPPATFAGNRPAGNQMGVKNMNLKCPKVSSKLTKPKFIKFLIFGLCTCNS
jgi:hypothetical protein